MTPPPLAWQDLESRLLRRDAAFDTGQVAWRGLGHGPSLVLLHGGHGSWAHWCRNVEALSAHFSVWVPDLPGYGDSTPPPSATLAALVNALRQSLDALLGAREPILLGGFSFGGLVAAHLAADRAARGGAVRALALLGAAGHGGARRPRGELLAWQDAWDRSDASALREVMRINLERHMLAGPADDEAVAIHTQACVRTRFKSKRISLSGGLQAVLATLSYPQWLLWGEHDVTATPQVLVPELARQLPQARIEVLPDAGHWVQYEAAERINPMLVDWFRAQDRSRP